ncbi:MAG: NUDIX domain-containing protein [Lachnospiraceae bacterium]|nr:NUDIX domain-containing protein [Lachnospiraceae bacterium]
MKLLKILDEKNYTDDMEVFEVTHSRALICVDGLYAMQRAKSGEYKLPGGRLEPGETPVCALIREVEEETGLIVDEKSIEEIGEIIEIRKDVFDDSKKYICHSLYYKCNVKDERGNLHRSKNEIEKGLELVWISADEMIASNKTLELESSRERDTIFMEMTQTKEANVWYQSKLMTKE